MSSWFRLGSVTGLLAAVIATAVFIGGQPSQAAPGCTVSVEPANTTVGPGDPFSVDIAIACDTAEAASFGFQLLFDPAVLEVTGTALGDFCDGTSCSEQIKILDNTGGVIDYAVTTLPLSAIPKTTGTLATINFTAEAPGTSALDLTNVELTDDQAALVPATAVDGLVIVQGPGSTPPPSIPTTTLTPAAGSTQAALGEVHGPSGLPATGSERDEDGSSSTRWLIVIAVVSSGGLLATHVAVRSWRRRRSD